MNPYNPIPSTHTLYSEKNPQPDAATIEQQRDPRLQQESKWSWHPLSLIVLGIWICCIAVYIFFLEQAVKVAPHNIDLSFKYSDWTDTMHTFFSQFHVSITALHLARVGVSAIQQESTAPRTWAELFWLADCAWSGPLSLGGAVITMIKKKIRVSLLFLVFAFTCMVAFVTPSILLRAYPLGSINATSSFTFTPLAFSPQAILDVDRDMEITTGMGSWATGLSVFGAYERSIYAPDKIPPRNISDFFFTGDIGDVNINLPGLRLQGGCAPFDDASTAVEQNPTLFPMFCNNSLPLPMDQKIDIKVSFGTANLTYSYCTYPSALTVPSGHDSNATAYIFIQSNNGTVGTTGMIKCQSGFSLGTASLLGMDHIYSSFVKNITYNPVQGMGLADPLSAVLAGMANASVVNDTSESSSVLIKQLGYSATLGNGNKLNFTQPSLDIFAYRIWLGVEHMTAGIGLLSRASDTKYNVTISTFAPTRSYPFFYGSFASLALWLWYEPLEENVVDFSDDKWISRRFAFHGIPRY
ncbi:hypothetical protein BU17DRAFT_61194 [Hysterangium stoloniferum]|nr:hypothetical protein BU17DRAFT_61194 [Hysterangium stoloniferum]